MLYLVATPIGNLEDVSYRAARILGEVDCIFAEDTRVSVKLLNRLEIKKPLFACDMHSEEEGAQRIAELLMEGKDVAYISDAGCPGISDPGVRIVKKCIDEGLEFTVIPGANAALSALVLSGLDTARFTFAGFLPRTLTDRHNVLSELAAYKSTLIFYESPNRVEVTLRDIASIMGDRQAALSRELTKLFEETRRGLISELMLSLAQSPIKGECVIIVEGASQNTPTVIPEELALALLAKGMQSKAVAKQVSVACDITKNAAYELVLKLKESK